MAYNPYVLSFRRIATLLVIVLISILAYALYPLVLITILLAHVFRCSLKLYVKYFKTEFGNIVTLTGGIFASDEPNKSTLTSIVIPVVFEGSIDINKLRNDILNKVLTRTSDGQLKYPELQQRINFICGYAFWKWDKNFDIKNHVHLGFENKTVLNESGVNLISAKLLRKPFGNVKSPWEVFVFPEYKPQDGTEKKCIIIVRLSHVLGDGVSMLQIVSDASTQQLQGKSGSFDVIPKSRAFISSLISIILAPYHLIKSSIDTVDPNYVRLPEEKKSKPLVVSFMKERIPVSLIRQLKNKIGTSFEGILTAAYTAGLRKFMLESKMEMPFELHSSIPVAEYQPRTKLRNRMSCCFLSLPVSLADSDARLKIITSNVRAQKVSRLSEQLYLLSLAVGAFPIALYRTILKSSQISGDVSNLIAPFVNMEYDGHRLLDSGFALGLHQGYTWFAISCLSFEGNLRIQLNFVESLGGEGNIQAFYNGVLEELQYLTNKYLV